MLGTHEDNDEMRPRAGEALSHATAKLGSITQWAARRVTHLAGENQNRVDDAPDDRAGTAGDQADNQLNDTQLGVAKIDAAYSDQPEKTDQLQQPGYELGLF